MPLATESKKMSLAEFVALCGDAMIPLSESLAYFSVNQLDKKDEDHLIHDPTSAFPPALAKMIPKLRLVLVPYLEADPDAGEGAQRSRISLEAPPSDAKSPAAFEACNGENYLFLAVQEKGSFDAHAALFRTLARRIIAVAGDDFTEPFFRLLDAELEAGAHGEVHDDSWLLKKELLGLGTDGESKAELFARYRLQSLEDTLTLYLHGLCCDLDLEASPKQLASQHIRKRLLLLKERLPPPDGIALFPEDLRPAR